MLSSLVHKTSRLLKKKDDSDDEKSTSIKAFRTIITMVHFIPSFRKLIMTELNPQSSEEVQELKVLNGLATLLVRRSEVAAVVATKHGDGSGVVQVIACLHCDSSSAELTIPQPASTSSILSNFLAVFNPRKDTLVLESNIPVITDPKTSIPSDIRNTEDIERIRTYIYDNWDRETHNTHAWMLSKLAGNYNILQDYVIAACFKKILFRMENGLSMPYYMGIISLSNFQFKETHIEPKTKEMNMENMFRSALGSLINAKLVDTPVTNLLAVISKGSVGQELYTKDTCQEFHLLLCSVLRHFLLHLRELSLLKKPNRAVFDNAVRKIGCFGEFLQTMAGSVAIQRHLKVIEDELLIFHSRAREVANQTPSNIETKPENDIELDVELQSVQPFVIHDGKQLPMWKAAKDWLKLMVVHFDALKIVNSHFKVTKVTKITIKIISPPVTDSKMLSWKDLLQDTKYMKFRNADPNPFSSKYPDPDPTAEDVIAFLEKNINGLDTAKGNSTILDMQNAVIELVKSSSFEAVSFTKLDDMLLGLRKGLSPDQAEITKRIRSMIKNLELMNGDDKSRRDLLYKILGLLDSLSVSALFFRKLRKGAPLSSETSFSGAHHCEILLASLIAMAESSPSTLPKDVLQELLNAGRVLGISKPSCPVCFEVLMTPGWLSKQFIFRGSHNTISKCTLPIWLPDEVIVSVAKKFGAQLKDDLVRLVKRGESEILPSRPKTAQSDTLSIDSKDGSTRNPYNDDDRDGYYASINLSTSAGTSTLNLPQ